MSKQKSKFSTKSSKKEVNPRVITNSYVSLKKCKHGLMMYNLNDLFVGRSLDLYGEWCEAELHSLGQLLKKGDTVIDIGANIGTHTVFFSKSVASTGQVIAFEPQRLSYEFLCANLALNCLINVRPIQMAVGNCVDDICIPVLDPNHPQNFSALNIEGYNQGDLIKLIPIDDLQLKKCNLIKIDVEGMELKVLLGAENTIRTHRPYLFVENNNKTGSPETVQVLYDLGYKCWWHIANYYNQNNFFQNKENVFEKFSPEANMICIPEEYELNVTGFEPVIKITDTWVEAISRLQSSKS